MNPSSVTDEIIAVFRAIDSEQEQAITPATTFEELGIDSLVLIEFAVALQRKFGVQVTDEEIAAVESFAATADLVATKSRR